MKTETFWLFRNEDYDCRDSCNPAVCYDERGVPKYFYYSGTGSFCNSWLEKLAPKVLHLDKFEAKKWRVTEDENGDVLFELLDWIYIDRK